jgi:hypothetical protein
MAMHEFSKFQQWINRDDGRFHRIGNRPLAALETSVRNRQFAEQRRLKGTRT